MKKKLLYFTCLLSFSLFTNTFYAQTTISFEAYEGYSVGSINGQNGWVVTSDTDNNFISGQEISTTYASHGTQSFKINEDLLFSPQPSAIMGGFYDFAAPLNSTHYTLEADLYISESDASNFELAIAGETNFIAIFQFNFENVFQTVEPSGTVLEWSSIPTITWQPETWYTLKIEVEGAVTKYYLDNNLIRTGVAMSSEQMQHMRFVHDNWGGYAHIDNITLTDLNSASTFNPEKFAYNVYPNPTNASLTVEMKENKGIDTITITDLNGRVIKTFEANKQTEITLDIADLSSGLYLVKISSDKSVETRKIVKK